MKQKILIYLVAFLVLLVLFQYVNAKRIFTSTTQKLNHYQERYMHYKDSVGILHDEILHLKHFNLENNDDALSYFENNNINTTNLEAHIKDKLYELNEIKGQHPVIPYASSQNRRMLINTVKILNHKWIIADFSDGEYWGEVFLNYSIAPDKTVEFTRLDSFLYPLD